MKRPRLADAHLTSNHDEGAHLNYERRAQRVGIVHFGVGAFHRAHQAMYTDAALSAGDRHWAITGVSLRSPDMRNLLQPQDFLYSLVEREQNAQHVRLIGALHQVLVAPEDPDRVIATLCAPDVHIVTFTVTEKGYLKNPVSGSLQTDDVDLVHDLAGSHAPRTLYGFLEHALARRRTAGLPGLTLVSCDNLAHNGRVLEGLLNEFLEARDKDLAAWARTEVRCPCTMVDRIVPAVRREDLQTLSTLTTYEDRAAVFTEPFSQWIIEDSFIGPRPRWESGGARFTGDVRSFETAKLRMLNGAHSTLAYVGLALGFEYVHQAIADPDLRALVERLMTTEAAQSFQPAADQSLPDYADALLRRFNNATLQHRLRQIAMDGSEKISQRWLPAIAALQARSHATPALHFALAAWLAFICSERTLDDPRSSQLFATVARCRGAHPLTAALFGRAGLFTSSWQAHDEDIQDIALHLEIMQRDGMRAALEQFLQSSAAR